jgi:hypothetical protein
MKNIMKTSVKVAGVFNEIQTKDVQNAKLRTLLLHHQLNEQYVLQILVQQCVHLETSMQYALQVDELPQPLSIPTVT